MLVTMTCLPLLLLPLPLLILLLLLFLTEPSSSCSYGQWTMDSGQCCSHYFLLLLSLFLASLVVGWGMLLCLYVCLSACATVCVSVCMCYFLFVCATVPFRLSLSFSPHPLSLPVSLVFIMLLLLFQGTRAHGARHTRARRMPSHVCSCAAMRRSAVHCHASLSCRCCSHYLLSSSSSL